MLRLSPPEVPTYDRQCPQICAKTIGTVQGAIIENLGGGRRPRHYFSTFYTTCLAKDH